MYIIILISIAMLALCGLDICKIIDLSKKRLFIFYLVFVPHLPLLWFHFINSHVVNSTDMFTYVCLVIFAIASVIFQIYTTMRLHLQMLRRGRTENFRINIIYAGRNLARCGLYGIYLMALWYLVCYYVFPVNPYDELIGGVITLFPGLSESTKTIAALSFEGIYALIFVWLFLFNGCLRIFFGSRNLVVGKRVVILLFMWVPIVQLYLVHIMCEAAKDEYLVAKSREAQAAFTKTDDACKTRYPIIMVHGIGFRDLRHYNYWGRIPEILEQHGAQIYYGHQNAWGTIEVNAKAISEVIDKTLEECGCDKVNIIAHSKGGLDCRYLISSLGYGGKVASLTTINTPHRGSQMITLLNKMPDYVYRYIANQLNKPSLVAGDTKPDCYGASKQLDPIYCQDFNEQNPDVEGVYYQSYTSVMKNAFSDSLLTIPYILMRLEKSKENDGLVDKNSAMWGNFRGLLKTKYKRGISHGDMIDLKREDIRGFDVLKLFYDIVVELKEMNM